MRVETKTDSASEEQLSSLKSQISRLQELFDQVVGLAQDAPDENTFVRAFLRLELGSKTPVIARQDADNRKDSQFLQKFGESKELRELERLTPLLIPILREKYEVLRERFWEEVFPKLLLIDDLKDFLKYNPNHLYAMATYAGKIPVYDVLVYADSIEVMQLAIDRCAHLERQGEVIEGTTESRTNKKSYR